ncbi:MAG: MMPL family transporter [Alphaproteobacteria bacterium]|nr:MMPL family transporter [Alphaproteobacteria bacterium]
MAFAELSLRRAAEDIVRLCARQAWVVVALSAVATIAAGLYVANRVAINTDTADMLDPALPFRARAEEYKRIFPQFADALLVVVDAPTPGAASDAASALAARLRAAPGSFRSVFYPSDDPFFRRNGLLYLSAADLQSLIDRLSAAQPFIGKLSEDPSLRGFLEVLGLAVRDAAKGRDGASAAMIEDLASVLDKVAATATAQAEKRALDLPWRDVLGGGALERKRQLILVQPQLDYASLSPGGAAIAAIRAAARDQRLPERGIQVRITGWPALQQDELATVRSNLDVVALLSSVLLALVLFVGIRSWRVATMILVVTYVGLVWTAAFAVAVFGTLNLISVAFAALFIGLGGDYAIHFGMRVQEEVDRGRPASDAQREVGGSMGFALAITTLGAGIGFLAFVPTDYRGLSQLGLIAAAGMLIAFVATLTLAPALLRLLALKPRPRGAPSGSPRPAGRLEQRPGLVVAAAGAIALAALPLAAQLRFDFDPMNLRDPHSESVRTFRDLMQERSTNPYLAVALVADLATADAAAERLRRQPTVAAARTLSSYVPDDQDRKLAAIEDASVILAPLLSPAARMPPPAPGERRDALRAARADLRILADAGAGADARAVAAAAHLDAALARLGDGDDEAVELESRVLRTLGAQLERLAESLGAERVAIASLPAELAARMVAPDGRARIEIVPAVDVGDAAALRRFIDQVEPIAPWLTGTPTVVLAARDAILASFAEASLVTVAGIALLLLALLRSATDMMLVLAPLLLAALLTAATAALLGISLNFANVIAVPLLFGLGVDSAVHLVARAREGATAADLGRSSTPAAVAWSALTTITSLGSMAISDHPGIASMGMLLTIAISYTLLCSLVALPALLALRERMSARRAVPVTSR